MGRVKDWWMEQQDEAIEALLDADPTMTAEEAHEIVWGSPYMEAAMADEMDNFQHQKEL